MSNIKQILIDETYQIKVPGKPNTWCRVVGKTAKRVYVWMYDGNAYVKDSNGNPIKFLKDPKNIKVSTKRAKGGKKGKRATA